MRWRILSALLAVFILISPARAERSQGQAQVANADVAAYQLGVLAEAKPGEGITYSITVTNYGPGVVDSFYIMDGWTVNSEGVSAFALPIPDPNFAQFTVAGTWEQIRPDQKVFAWLLNGKLAPGDTIKFDWQVQVAQTYIGGLVNWARIVTNGDLAGAWQPREQTASATPPKIASVVDPDDMNNRTPDGVTVVTDAPTGQGVDMAVYQTGLLTLVKVGDPIVSTLLVTNLGPQAVKQFYVLAGWSLDTNGGSILAKPISDPDFGDFKVVGRWQQAQQDEELWLWLVEGPLESGQSAAFNWSRNIVPTYRGDLINWSRVYVHDVPDGDWTPREGTTAQPKPLDNPADTNPKNDRSTDGLTTVVE